MKRLTQIVSRFKNDAGLGKTSLVGLGAGVVIVVGVGYFVFAGGQPQAPIQEPGEATTTLEASDTTETTVPSPAAEPLTADELAMFKGLLGEVGDQEFYDMFGSVDAPVTGDITDPGLELTHAYGGTFMFGPKDVGAVQKLTGIRPAQGVHSFFVTETAGPQSNPAIDYQLGFGFRPGSAPASTGEPDANEPIARDPHSYAFFAFPETGWQEVQVFDVANNFAPLQDKGIIFFDAENVFSAFIVPQRFVAPAGEPGILTVQVFGRQTPEGQSPSLKDPIGLSGGTFNLGNIPDSFPAPIFADGFESGDVSAWSSGEDLPPSKGTYFFDEFESFR